MRKLRRKVQSKSFRPKMQYLFMKRQRRFRIVSQSFALIVNGVGDLSTEEGH